MSQVVLAIAAHPDDEVLGCAGTLARHVQEGDSVHVLFLADGVSSRLIDSLQPALPALIERREHMARQAAGVLGFSILRFLRHPDNSLDKVPLLHLARDVDVAVKEIGPDIVYTHHGGDLNIDHRMTHQAAMTACRPLPGSCVRSVYAWETPSSTEWASAEMAPPFQPSRYVDISEQLGLKFAALACYGDEIPPFPHARSTEAISALAKWRGASVGRPAAEVFSVIRQIIA